MQEWRTLRVVCAFVLASLLLVLSRPQSDAAAQQLQTTVLGEHRLIANMHGLLFHDETHDLQEDVTYAQWLGAGAIRAFATDSNSLRPWDGRRVGSQVVRLAPMLRASNIKLIVALVNNHRAVPGEVDGASGWLDNYQQLLLPFFTADWRGQYLNFMRDLIGTVRDARALDVIGAWELGNELHTPEDPRALMPFITQAVAELRAVDPTTPVWPGTMGANHVEPGMRDSAIARWLYCDAPVDAYTLHAYDWIGPDRPGDMPINWDLDIITSQPCPNGRSLPVIVEELGTSRGLASAYGPNDEATRIVYELRQLRRALSYAQVVGVGVWNAESPLVEDTTFFDIRRGLTSYGAHALGGGSCLDPRPDPGPGPRCQYEQVLQQLSTAWADVRPTPWATAAGSADVVGMVNPPSAEGPVTLTGWILDTANLDDTFVDQIDVYFGTTALARGDVSPADGRFRLDVPAETLPEGVAKLTLRARGVDGQSWSRTVGVIVPGSAAPPVPPAAPPPPPPRLEVAAPAPGSSVSTGQVLEGSVSDGIDRIEVYLEPGRDAGGKLLGALTRARSDPNSWSFVLRASRGWHTVYIHAHSAVSGQEAVVAVPLKVS